MTMTRPLRRITLHLSQIFLTLGWTFIASCLFGWIGQEDVAMGWCADAEGY
jgi:hypothetical protein